MAALRPWVGIQQEGAADTGVGERLQERAGVVGDNPNVREALTVDVAQQTGNPVQVGLAADQADIGMGPGLKRQMFASAKSDLQPNVPRRRGEGGAGVKPTAGIGWPDRNPRQQAPQQLLAARPQFAPAPPAVEHARAGPRRRAHGKPAISLR